MNNLAMKKLELCYIKFCKNSIAEAYVWHHHDSDKVNCNFNPFIDQPDESHCILKFCNKHAEEFKLVQKGDNVKGLDIQFKDYIHYHNN